MKYFGLLTTEEVRIFIPHFYALDNAKTTNVEIKPDRTQERYLVILKPESIVEDLLDASFNDGMLNHWGWSKKFSKK